MLKIKINKGNAVLGAEKINYSEVTFDNINNYIIFETNIPHNFKNNDTIRIENKINNKTITIDKNVTVIDSNHFKVNGFTSYNLYVKDVQLVNLPFYYGSEKKSAIQINLAVSHEITKNRKSGFVTQKIDGGENGNEIISKLTNGDSVLYYDTFLYTIKNNGQLPDSYDNIKCPINILIDNVYKEIECIVPIGDNGLDDEYALLYFPLDNNDNIYDYIINNSNFISLNKKDTRFIDSFNDNISLQESVTVYKLKNDFHVKIVTGNQFSTNLFQNELIQNDFVNVETEKAINPIVNMEKYCFNPVCCIDDKYNYLPITEINYNFHFRDRNGSDNWQTDDTKYWNSYNLVDNKLEYRSDNFFSIDQSDLIGYLNFTDQDVLYQKNKLKKSFLRLSFYSSKDLNTQRLLFYSTIFIDSGRLFGCYTNNINNLYYTNQNNTANLPIGVYNEYKPNEKLVDETKRLSSHLSVTDRYNSGASSEGFYLYLFSETAPKYEPVSIYMKAEFNHAGYGRTIPFIMPTTVINDEVLPIDPISDSDLFPITYNSIVWSDYLNDDVNGKTVVEIPGNIDKDLYLEENRKYLEKQYENNPSIIYKYNNEYFILTNGINMNRLYDDMFIEIKVKYDYKSKQYIWYMPRYINLYNGSTDSSISNYNGKLVFNLFEPKIQ